MDGFRDHGSSRSVCIVFLVAATIVSGFYTLLRILLLMIGLVHRIRSHSLPDQKKIPRRWRKLWKLVSEIVLPAICTLISVTAIYGFLYDSINWMTFSIIAFFFIIILDYFLFYDRHFEKETVVASLLYSLTSFHLMFALIIFVTNIMHVVRVYKLRQTVMYEEEDKPLGPVNIEG